MIYHNITYYLEIKRIKNNLGCRSCFLELSILPQVLTPDTYIWYMFNRYCLQENLSVFDT